MLQDAVAIISVLVAGNTLLSPSDKKQEAGDLFFQFFSELFIHLFFFFIFFKRVRGRCLSLRWATI